MVNKQALRLKVRIKKASKYNFLSNITIENLVRWVSKIDKISPEQRLFVLVVFEELRIRGVKNLIEHYEKNIKIYKRLNFRL